jgi:hypothetical protein
LYLVYVCCHGKNNPIHYGSRRDWKLSAAELQSSTEKESGVSSTAGKRWMQWLNKHGVSSRIYYLNSNSSTKTTTTSAEVPEGLESIAKILSVGDDEMLGISLQFYKDKAHAYEVYLKMMQDEKCGAIGKEFNGLVTPGKGMITDGFSRLGV